MGFKIKYQVNISSVITLIHGDSFYKYTFSFLTFRTHGALSCASARLKRPAADVAYWSMPPSRATGGGRSHVGDSRRI